MIFSPMQPFRWRLLHRCDNLISPWGGRGSGCEITTRPISAPNRLGLLPRCNALRLVHPTPVNRPRCCGLAVAPCCSPKRARLSRPRGRTPSERRWAMDGPSARAVGQTGEPREPDAGGRTSGGGLSFGDFSLATQRKVTRQAAQRRRNPVEDGVLVSYMAKPCTSG